MSKILKIPEMIENPAWRKEYDDIMSKKSTLWVILNSFTIGSLAFEVTEADEYIKNPRIAEIFDSHGVEDWTKSGSYFYIKVWDNYGAEKGEVFEK